MENLDELGIQTIKYKRREKEQRAICTVLNCLFKTRAAKENYLEIK